MTFRASRAVFRRIALGLSLGSAMAGSAHSQDLAQGLAQDLQRDLAGVQAPAGPGLGLPKGALVFHGNYCGPGSRGNNPPPVDALDRACMHHDACSPPVGQGLPPCSCNQRLYSEASAVAQSPRTPDDVRVAADVVAEGAKVMACR